MLSHHLDGQRGDCQLRVRNDQVVPGSLRVQDTSPADNKLGKWKRAMHRRWNRHFVEPENIYLLLSFLYHIERVQGGDRLLRGELPHLSGPLLSSPAGARAS